MFSCILVVGFLVSREDCSTRTASLRVLKALEILVISGVLTPSSFLTASTIALICTEAVLPAFSGTAVLSL